MQHESTEALDETKIERLEEILANILFRQWMELNGRKAAPLEKAA